jgi:hypothetical protein
MPYIPSSRPFIERKIGCISREYWDHVIYWYGADLERKLYEFKKYFNGNRIHGDIHQMTLIKRAEVSEIKIVNFQNYKWHSQGNGFY